MNSHDYISLVERIRSKMASWTSRFLSYAGRLQLLNSIISSIINFWISAYRLPISCIRELEKLYSAFLWSMPDLNTRKAKLAWQDVCQPKDEGGLGFKCIKEANQVCCLKLIWKVISSQNTLWIRWIKSTYLQKDSFWTAKSKQGSWMWKKILKYRDIASSFHRVDVRNGRHTSFWFDKWSSKGRLHDLTGQRGYIDLANQAHATVELVIQTHRKKYHCVEILNDIEEEIMSLKQRDNNVDDISLWKSSEDMFSKCFKTRNTWRLLRGNRIKTEWS